MNLREFAAAVGMDLDGTLIRFSNMEKLVIKFLKKFPDDPTFGELAAAMAEQDHEKILRASHTLKGVAGNLGLTRLFEINQKMVDEIRAGVYENLEADFREDKEAYEFVIGKLKELQA